MKKRLTLVLTAGALVAAMLPGVASAAQKSGCPAAESGWYQVDIDVAAQEFFPHLLPDYGFADAGEFADAIVALYDQNGDGDICAKEAWGYGLNPKSHWYRYGLELLGEPLHLLFTRDNNANGA